MCLLTQIKPNKRGLLTTLNYEQLNPLQKIKICNGMGSDSTWWNKLLKQILPNHFFGLDMTEAANVHDYMFWRGGSRWDYFVANFVFLYNMCWLIYQAGSTHRLKRYFMAMRYFTAVFWGGRSSFNFIK